MTEKEILETRIKFLKAKLSLIVEGITFNIKVWEQRLAALDIEVTQSPKPSTPGRPDISDFKHGPF